MSSFSKSLKPIFEGLITPILELLEQKHISPNIVSIAGVVVISVGSYFAYLDHNIIGGLLLGIGGIFDAIDGALARKTNKVSNFGAFLDSTLDRISDAMPIMSLILFYTKSQDTFGAFLGLLALIFGFLVSYTKARSHSLGVDIPIGFFERTERFGILVLSILFGFYKFGLLIISLGAFYTTIERIFYAKAHLNQKNIL